MENNGLSLNFVNKGEISAIISITRATVVPAFSDDPVTVELVVPWFLWDCLEVGMQVVYAQFPDNTGIILSRMDGEWNHKLWQTQDGDYAVAAMTGNIRIEKADLVTHIIASYHGHTHVAPHGPTTEPVPVPPALLPQPETPVPEEP